MPAFFEIEDLKDANGNASGTQVALKIQLAAIKEELV
jgi:hypothetical protein